MTIEGKSLIKADLNSCEKIGIRKRPVAHDGLRYALLPSHSSIRILRDHSGRITGYSEVSPTWATASNHFGRVPLCVYSSNSSRALLRLTGPRVWSRFRARARIAAARRKRWAKQKAAKLSYPPTPIFQSPFTLISCTWSSTVEPSL